MTPRLPVAERRHQLIDAALTVAAREGVQAVTARRVAAEAGVSLGVVHYCFDSVTDLLAQVATVILDANLAAAREVLRPGDDLPRVLHEGLRGLWEFIEASRDLQLLTYELTTHALRHAAEPGSDSGYAGLAARQQRDSLAAAQQFLDAAAQAAGVRWSVPTGLLARMVLAVESKC